MLAFNGVVLTGWYVAVFKWLLEWTKVAAAGERPVGVVFWWVADAVSNLLSRTLLPPPGKVVRDPRGVSRLWCHRWFLDALMCNWLDAEPLVDVSMLLLRVDAPWCITGCKREDPHGFAERVIAVYFAFLPGSPLFWTYLSATFELVGSACLVLGVLVRPAAGLLAGTMANAVAFQLMSKGLQNWPFGQPPDGAAAYAFEPALAFLVVCVHILFAGPGRFGLQTGCRPVWDADRAL